MVPPDSHRRESLRRESLVHLSRKELQSLAKSVGVKANTSNQTLVEELCALGHKLRDSAPGSRDQDLHNTPAAGAAAASTTPPVASTSLTPPISSSAEVSTVASSLAALKLRSRLFGGPQHEVHQHADQARSHHQQAAKSAGSPRVAQATPLPGIPTLPELQGMDSYLEALQTAQRTITKPYCGMLLMGPAGNGKKSLAQALAHGMGARYHVLDLAAAISAAEDPQHAGEAVRAQCRLVARAAEAGSVVLVVDHLEALSAADHAKARARIRARAELLITLNSIKQHATQRAQPGHSKGTGALPRAHAASGGSGSMTPLTSRSTASCAQGVVVVGILQSQGPTQSDEVLLSCLLDAGEPAAVAAALAQATATAGAVQGALPIVLHMPPPDCQRREAVLYHVLFEASAELNAFEMEALMEAITRAYGDSMSVELLLGVCAAAAEQAAVRAKQAQQQAQQPGPPEQAPAGYLRLQAAEPRSGRIHWCDMEAAWTRLTRSK